MDIKELNNTARTDDADIETVHVVGAAVSSFSVILNGLLLIGIFKYRKKACFTGRHELSSLIASDFVIGVALVSMFIARKTLSIGSATDILRLTEEAIYFTSKCVTINHLLLISINGLLRTGNVTTDHRANKSFRIQTMFVWFTTLSWLVIPVILLGNQCSGFSFGDCDVLKSGPLLMVQFLSFIFGCPLVLTNIIYVAYLVMSLRRGESPLGKCNTLTTRLFRWKRAPERKRWSFEEHGVDHLRRDVPNSTITILENATDDLKTNDGFAKSVDAADNKVRKTNSINSCIVHFGSFERQRIEGISLENKLNETVLAIGLMLLVFDISVLSIITSFLRLIASIHIDVIALKYLYFLTFLNQAANPIIFILTFPNLKLIIQKRKFLNPRRERRPSNGLTTFKSTLNDVQIHVTPPLKQRFKTVSFVKENKFCSCSRNGNRRSTVDGVVISERQRRRLAQQTPARFTSDTMLMRHFEEEHICESTATHGETVQIDSPATLRVPKRRKHSEISGRSVTSGGLSIEMESQMSVSDLLSCLV